MPVAAVGAAVAATKRPASSAAQALRALRGAAAGLGAACTLPGPAAAVEADFAWLRYDEGPVAAADAASGESESRFAIDSQRLRLAGEGARTRWQAGLTLESLSGASPWYAIPDAQDGRPLQVLSGASIREQRTALDVSLEHGRAGERRWQWQAGYSQEDDYRSAGLGLGLAWDSADRLWTHALAVHARDDQLRPTEGGSERYPERVRAADKRVLAVDASSEAVLSRRAVAQLALTLSREQGFLSDPYKLVWVASEANTAPDRRPRERDALALALRARYHLGGGQALHLEWAHSRDDWKLRSHTLSLRLQALAGERGRVAFGLRWYSQSQAAFYAPFFTTRPDSGEQSSDPRLAPFGALAVQLDLQRPLGDWRLGGGVEAYAADADYALREVAVEAPGLTRYWSAYLSLGRRW